MPQPTANMVHINRPLTNISVAYRADLTQYAAMRIFPAIPVDHKSDTYFVYDKGDWFRDEAKRRSDYEESAGSGYSLGTDQYNTITYAFHKDIPREVRLNADPVFNLERDATEFVTQRISIRQERDWSATYFTTGVWANEVTGVDSAPGADQFLQWDDAASDPLADIKRAKRAIMLTTGYMPNVLVLGFDVFEALKDHPDIIERIKYTTSDNVTQQMLADWLGVARIEVLSGIFNNAQEGAADDFEFVHANAAWLGYTAPSPSVLQPTAGYAFTWRGISAGLGQDLAIKRIDLSGTGREVVRIEGEAAWDFKVVAPDMGYFFASAVAEPA